MTILPQITFRRLIYPNWGSASSSIRFKVLVVVLAKVPDVNYSFMAYNGAHLVLFT